MSFYKHCVRNAKCNLLGFCLLSVLHVQYNLCATELYVEGFDNIGNTKWYE